jgi:uncharacterized protein (DUF362 family)
MNCEYRQGDDREGISPCRDFLADTQWERPDIPRRGFLRTCAGAAASLFLPVVHSSAEDETAATDTSGHRATSAESVVVETEATGEYVDRLLKPLGGIGSFVHEGSLVLIKPNFSFANPSAWATTTDPGVVAAVARACLQAGARRVLVADHLMGDSPEQCFGRTGAATALESLGRAVSLVSLDSERRYQEVELPPDPAVPGIRAAREALAADCLINVPVAKSHTATGVSLGMKNLMGLVWDRVAYHRSGRIHRAVAETAWALRPELIILDATRVLATGGPQGPGEVIELGKVFASTDQVAIDAVGATLSAWGGRTYRPADLAYVREAEALGLGSSDARLLEV